VGKTLVARQKLKSGGVKAVFASHWVLGLDFY
jgi:hypothetical protein